MFKQPFHTSRQASAFTFSKLALFVGATGAMAVQAHSKILNDAVNLGTINRGSLESNVKKLDPTTTPTNSALDGKLHFRQLCYGSLVGLFTGVVIGKLSSVLGFIALSGALLLQVSSPANYFLQQHISTNKSQFLHTRGIITVPWTSIVKVGSDRIDLRSLFLEDPSFKLSFALTFIIAAFNI